MGEQLSSQHVGGCSPGKPGFAVSLHDGAGTLKLPLGMNTKQAWTPESTSHMLPFGLPLPPLVYLLLQNEPVLFTWASPDE